MNSWVCDGLDKMNYELLLGCVYTTVMLCVCIRYAAPESILQIMAMGLKHRILYGNIELKCDHIWMHQLQQYGGHHIIIFIQRHFKATTKKQQIELFHDSIIIFYVFLFIVSSLFAGWQKFVLRE